MSATMKDIARDLSLSIVTVSKVLHNHPDIGEETRKRVLKRMAEVNFRPNLTARSLVTGRTFLVGLVVPDLMHPFFAEIAKALSSALRAKDYYLIIACSEEDQELEAHEIDQMLGRRLDGLIIASAHPTQAMFSRIEQQKTPYVLIDRQFPEMKANFVGIDDEAIGMLATEHLIDVGCKRIAHIGGPETSPAIKRREGYKRALQAHGMREKAEYIVSGVTSDVESHKHGWDAMGALLALPTPPDGVFCFNDPLAIGAIDRILDEGLKVPEDIAVIGSGNLHYDGSLRVALSSVDQCSRQLGEQAGNLLLNLIETKAAGQPRSIVLEPKVVPRLSSQRVKRGRKKSAA
jgi:LacI family transcriptional regulator